MSVVISTTRREPSPHFSERNKVRAWRKTMNTILKASTVACGLIAVGCASRMTALNSELPSTNKGGLNGDYVLASVKVLVEDLDAASVSEAISAASKDIFKGSDGNKQSLPVTISVERDKADGNGGIASVNNLFAFCTLTIWPWVSADEYSYKVKARSVVGEHEVSFKVIDRSWGGLSPFAIIPVPGWADERGDDSELVKFHLSQIAAGAKAACGALSSDYQTFLKDQSKYLELIDQERSEVAFASFIATKKASALDGLTNEVVKNAHQNDLVAAFKNSDTAEVKSAVLKKLDDDSLQKLPYDPSLIPYWKKVENKRFLALIYRDGFASLVGVDRTALASKIVDETILSEMVTEPSREFLREEENKKEHLANELKDKIREAKQNAEEHSRYAKNAKNNWQFNEEKREKREAENYLKQAIQLQAKLTALNNKKSDGLYITDANARAILYSQISSETLVKMANDKVSSQTFADWKSGHVDCLSSAAVMCGYVKEPKAIGDVAASVLNKIASFRAKCANSWSYSWTDKDRNLENEIVAKVCSKLDDEMIVGFIEKDREKWASLSGVVKDKKRISQLAVKYLAEVRVTKNADKIKDAWNAYGDAIIDNAALEEIAVRENILRDAALAQIKDNAAKAHAQEAVKAEIARRAALRQQKLAKVVAVAEKDADEMRSLFSHVKINSDQQKRAKQVTMGRPFYMKNVKVWNENVSAPQGTKRIMVRADLDGSDQMFFCYADFDGDYKAALKGLKDFSITSVFGCAIRGTDYTNDLYLEAMIATGKEDKDFVAFLEKQNISDEMLDLMTSEKESIMRRFAKDEELEFPNVNDSTAGKKPSLGGVLESISDLKKGMDEIDAAKKEVGNAWSDLKKEVKKGVDDAVGGK